MGQQGYLFSENSLSAALQAQHSRLAEAARKIPGNHVLATSVEELAQELVEEFKAELLDINWDGMTSPPGMSRLMSAAIPLA